MKVYVLIEYCCNHFEGVYSSIDELLEGRWETVEELENNDYVIREYELGVKQ